jgi:DNA-binding protein YbaB
MGREIDEAFIDEAVQRYQRVEARLAEFHRASAAMDVTVQSPDGLVQVVVSVAGVIRDVVIDERLLAESNSQVGTSVRLAVVAATDAAEWARAKLHAETFSDYFPISSR